jgi:hypothetical protein
MDLLVDGDREMEASESDNRLPLTGVWLVVLLMELVLVVEELVLPTIEAKLLLEVDVPIVEWPLRMKVLGDVVVPGLTLGDDDDVAAEKVGDPEVLDVEKDFGCPGPLLLATVVVLVVAELLL